MERQRGAIFTGKTRKARMAEKGWGGRKNESKTKKEQLKTWPTHAYQTKDE